MLIALSSPPIYTKYIRLPDKTSPTSDKILNNTKFYPYFKDALGAINGTYIPCYVPVKDQSTSWNQKGVISRNCLACVSFNLQFTYMLSRWECWYQMHGYIMMLVLLTYIYLQVNITSLMLDSQHVMSSWYPIVVYITTWQKGGRHHTCKYLSLRSVLY